MFWSEFDITIERDKDCLIVESCRKTTGKEEAVFILKPCGLVLGLVPQIWHSKGDFHLATWLIFLNPSCFARCCDSKQHSKYLLITLGVGGPACSLSITQLDTLQLIIYAQSRPSFPVRKLSIIAETRSNPKSPTIDGSELLTCPFILFSTAGILRNPRSVMAKKPAAKALTAKPDAASDVTSSDGGVALYMSYFDRFKTSGFVPNPEATIQSEMTRLAQHMRWSKKETSKERLIAYREEILRLSGFQHAQNNATAYRQLCKDLGIEEVPKTVKDAKRLLSPVHVNLFDYVNCKRAGLTVQPVYTNKAQLIQHTLAGLAFPKQAVKSNGGIRVLLERLS